MQYLSSWTHQAQSNRNSLYEGRCGCSRKIHTTHLPRSHLSKFTHLVQIYTKTLNESGCRCSREINTTHLPGSHLSKVTQVSVAVLFDGKDWCVCWQKHGWLQAFATCVAPQARWKCEISGLIILIVTDVACTILGELAAQQLWSTSGVFIQLNRKARWCVTMAASVA